MAKKPDGSVIIEVEALTADFEKKLKSVNKIAMAGFVATTTAVAGLSTAIISVGKGFETSMAKASTLFGDVNVDVGNLNSKVLELSNSTGIAATELSNSLYSALSAGVKVTEDMASSMTFLERNSKLAIAGFTDVDTAVQSTAKVLNAYGMDVSEIDRVSGILMTTQNLGITTVGQLSASLAQVTPTAAAMKVSFEQVGASLALMTAKGTETSMATTQLNALFAELGKNGTMGSLAMYEALETTDLAGKSFAEMMGEGVQLNTVLGYMSDHASDNGLSMLDMFSSIESGKAALSISSDMEAYDSNMQAMSNTAGVVDEAYEKMQDTFEGKSKILQESLTNVGITAYSKFQEPLKKSMDVAIESLDELSNSTEFNESVDELAESFSGMLNVAIDLAKNVLPILIDSLSWVLKNAKPIAVGLGTITATNKGMKLLSIASKSYKDEMKLISVATKKATGTTVKLTAVTKLQTIAQMALNALKTPMGLGLVVGAVTACTVAYIDWTKKTNEQNISLIKHNKAIEESILKMQVMGIESSKQMESSTEEIILAEKYRKELLENIDAEGVYIGEKGKMMMMLDSLNKTFPDLNASYDEHTGKILDQTGEVVSLDNSVKKLIETKKVEAYMDAYNDDYMEAMKQKEEAINRQMEAQKELMEVEAQLVEKGPEIDEYNRLMTEGQSGMASAVLERAGLLDSETLNLIARKQLLDQAISDDTAFVASNNSIISSYEDVYACYASGDIEGALTKLNNTEVVLFDPEKSGADVEIMKAQVKSFEDDLVVLNALKVSGNIDENSYNEMYEKILEKQKLSQTQLEESEALHNIKMQENSKISDELITGASKSLYTESFVETGLNQVAEAKTATNNTTKAIDDLIHVYKPPTVYIPVEYVVVNSPPSGTGIPTEKKDSYGGRSSTPQPFVMSIANLPNPFAPLSYKNVLHDPVGYARNEINSISSGMSKRINIDVATNNSSQPANVKVEQTNNFNQPISRPSDVTRAIEKQSRYILKVR